VGGTEESYVTRLSQVLERLVVNKVQFLKVSASAEAYSVNWREIFKVAQESMMESTVSLTHNFGPYHTRVLRILKKQGYLSELQVQQMCLLPPRDTRAVLN